jgi:hypothetical protein
MKLVDMTGKQVGQLSVLSFVKTDNGRAIWLCRCGCGKDKEISGKLLRSGKIVSCGCSRGAKKIYADYAERRKELHIQNPEVRATAIAKYREIHKERRSVSNRITASKQRAKRRLLKSEPKWSEKQQISVVYEKAKELGFEVDHIVPLVSDTVCGLHVWCNLQLLALQENRTKSNKVWPDMWPRRLANTELQGITS